MNIGIIGLSGGRTMLVSGLLLVVSGLLVIPARLIGMAYEIGNPLLIVSDILGVCAILCLGSPGIGRLIGRIVRMVNSLRLGVVGNRGAVLSQFEGEP